MSPVPDAAPETRLVLDTNVVVSGLLWNGPPRQLLELSIDGSIMLWSSAALLDELAVTLARAKFAPRIEAFGTSAAALVAHYTGLVSLVFPTSAPRVVPRDADDDHVIAAAVAARAGLIVTGDRRHLLPIGSHRGIAIVTPRDALVRTRIPR